VANQGNERAVAISYLLKPQIPALEESPWMLTTGNAWCLMKSLVAAMPRDEVSAKYSISLGDLFHSKPIELTHTNSI
jgi:hypothetical protein